MPFCRPNSKVRRDLSPVKRSARAWTASRAPLRFKIFAPKAGLFLKIGFVAITFAFNFPMEQFRVYAAESVFDQQIPSIKQVAVMPIYWQGQFPESHNFGQLKKQIEDIFPKIARASKRFYFTNDVISSDLWATPEGRKELSEEYEIDGFLNLTISSQSDLMQWTVRLLSPSLQNYISESDRIPYSWFLSASPEAISKRLQDLVFRTLNRYPVDVFVTSVQGRYVSLSAGTEQQILEGDELTFYGFTLKSIHPVDSSWLGFNKKLLGKAKVIESKGQTAVAVINSLSYENAIKTGDGASVANIATRRNFQVPKLDDQRYVPVGIDSAIVQALGEDTPTVKTEKSLPVPNPSPKNPRLASNEQRPKVDPSPSSEPTNDVEALGNSAESAPPLSPDTPEESEQDFLPIHFKSAQFFGTMENLSFAGSAKMSSRTPDLFLNRFGVKGIHDITEGWQGWYTGSIRMGKTSKGSYTGFNLQAEGLKSIDTLSNRIPSLKQILLGGHARIDSIGVTKENFGGWDGLFLGPTLHLLGSHHIVEWVQMIDFDIHLTYLLIGQGNAGIRGKKRDLDSGSTTEVESSAFFRGKSEDIEWGALLDIETASWKLSKGSISESNLAIGVLGRMQF
jgi:hypothetical protein